MPRVKLEMWKMKDGSEIPVRDMADDHLVNAIRMLQRNSDKRYREASRGIFWEEDIMPEPQWFDSPHLDMLSKHAFNRGIKLD